MRKNVSPWLHQLNKERPQKTLEKDIATDVVIVGAGIAGVASAFFTLKYTQKKVVLLDRFRLAHGATGHNAGQVVSYFERGFASIVKEFGSTLAAAGQTAIDNAWELLDEMYTDAKLDIPFSRFLGYGGLTSYEQVAWYLENDFKKRAAGISSSLMQIAKESGIAERLPREYDGLYEVVPYEKIFELLETRQKDYIAVLLSQKGCINSALFCQEVVQYLLTTYADRFTLYEHSPVHKIILRDKQALLDVETHTVSAERIVLCTNGFENLHIINENGLDIDAKYHHLVSGKVGYMSGYLEAMHKPPIAISYFVDPIAGEENSYYYLTRRPYEYEEGSKHNLISIGGPDTNIDEKTDYSHEDEYPDEMSEKIDDFVHATYSIQPHTKINYIFTWHGLMGYTSNKIRLIGPEPQNPVLLYNLGCNGVGILPSAHGGRVIARHLAGEKIEKSIFDVPPGPKR